MNTITEQLDRIEAKLQPQDGVYFEGRRVELSEFVDALLKHVDKDEYMDEYEVNWNWFQRVTRAVCQGLMKAKMMDDESDPGPYIKAQLKSRFLGPESAHDGTIVNGKWETSEEFLRRYEALFDSMSGGSRPLVHEAVRRKILGVNKK